MFRRIWKLSRALQRLLGRFRPRQQTRWFDDPIYDNALVFTDDGCAVDVDEEQWKIA